MEKRSCAVLGGLGFLGGHIVRQLLKGVLVRRAAFRRGHISAIGNSDPNYKRCDQLFIESGFDEVLVIDSAVPVSLDCARTIENAIFLRIDVTDTKLEKVLKGCHTVFYVVGDDDEITRKKGVANALDSARRANVKFFIYTSGVDAVAPNSKWDDFEGGEWSPYDSTSVECPKAAARQINEKLVLNADGVDARDTVEDTVEDTLENENKSDVKEETFEGMRTCIMRPPAIYGDGCEKTVETMAKAIFINGAAPARRYAPVDRLQTRAYAGNVAWMHILAALRPDLAAGQIFYCYDDTPSVSFEEFNQLIWYTFGLHLQPVPVPFWRAWASAVIIEFLTWLGYCENDEENATIVTSRRALRARNAKVVLVTDKARSVLGYEPSFDWGYSLGVTRLYLGYRINEVRRQR